MEQPKSTAIEIALNRVMPNPYQPRQTFNAQGLLDLAQSIKAVGLIQPIVVESVLGGECVFIHDGERRWRASCLLAIAAARSLENDWSPDALVTLLPIADQIAALSADEIVATFLECLKDQMIAVVALVDNSTTAQDQLVRALVANVQREDLNPIDLARGYEELHQQGLSNDQIGRRVGKDRSTISNTRGLLALPDEVQALVAKGDLDERHARELKPIQSILADSKEAVRLANEAVRRGWSADQVATEVGWVISRKTQTIAGHLLAFENWGGHLPDGCQARCRDCSLHTRFRKDHLCTSPNQYQGKYKVWIARLEAIAAELTGLPIFSNLSGGPELKEVEMTLARNLNDGRPCQHLAVRHANWATTDCLVDNENLPKVHYSCQLGYNCECRKYSRAMAEGESAEVVNQKVVEYQNWLSTQKAETEEVRDKLLEDLLVRFELVLHELPQEALAVFRALVSRHRDECNYHHVDPKPPEKTETPLEVGQMLALMMVHPTGYDVQLEWPGAYQAFAARIMAYFGKAKPVDEFNGHVRTLNDLIKKRTFGRDVWNHEWQPVVQRARGLLEQIPADMRTQLQDELNALVGKLGA